MSFMFKCGKNELIIFQSISRHNKNLTFSLVIAGQFYDVGLILGGNIVCSWKIALINGSFEICKERMPAAGLVCPMSRA